MKRVPLPILITKGSVALDLIICLIAYIPWEIVLGSELSTLSPQVCAHLGVLIVVAADAH